jgi:hypothetical protein
MKKLIAAALLLAPVAASADYVDVIEFKLKDGCEFSTYMAIVKDFNAYAKDLGYQTEIGVKLHHPDPTTHLWLGRSANAKTFGKAWDTYRAALSDPASTPYKLQQRFDACGETVSRRSYDSY